jgi:hypothetical protein
VEFALQNENIPHLQHAHAFFSAIAIFFGTFTGLK